MRRLGIVSLLILLQVAASAGSPAVVHLRDGRRMSGEIVSETAANILLDTPDQRRWRIPRVLIDRVQRLMQAASLVPPKPTPAPTVKPPAKTVPKAKPAPAKETTKKPATVPKAKSSTKPADKKPTPAKTAKKPATTKKATTKPAAKPTPKPPVKKKPAKGKWSHDVRMGMDLRYTAVTQQTVHSRVKSTYASKAFRNQLDWNFAYGKTAAKVSADRMSGLMKTDWTFDSGVYVYHTGSAGYDRVRRIALRYEIGPGVGYHVFRGRKLLFSDSKFNLDLESGGEYEYKLSTTGRITERYFWRLAQLIRWNIGKDLTFTEEFEYFPRIGELVNNRYHAEANFAYRLVKNLSLNLTVLAEADPQRLNDFVPDDLQIRSSLGWRF